ncbi:MAG: DUF2339 domain-containing protein [Acidobacteria bacterium]|nr:DUF2339 domain-containing protein [Acidobacteriota bacterium]
MSGPPRKPENRELTERIDALGERLGRVLDEVQGLAAELHSLRSRLGGGEAAAPVELPVAEGGDEIVAAAAEVVDEGSRAETGEVTAETEVAPEPRPVAASPRVAAAEASAPHEPADRPPREDLETRIGAVWFLRAGLLFVVIAFALATRWVAPQLLPWQRVLASYLGAAALFAVGFGYGSRLQAFARPMMAGGLALGFFTSFAAYFLPALRCLPLLVSLLLMTGFVTAIFACAERWRSESTAGLALFLGHVAAYVASVDTDILSMIAVLFLSVTAVALMLRHDWVRLTLLAAVAAYSSHFLWALADTRVAVGAGGFALRLTFLTAYYLTFLVADAVFTHRAEGEPRRDYDRAARVTGRAIGPTAMVLYATLAAALFQDSAGMWRYMHYFFLPLAAVQLLMLLLHHRKGTADVPLYVTASTVFATLGLFSSLGGLALNMALAAEALLLLVMGQVIAFGFLRHLARVVLLVNFVHFWFSEARDIDSWPTFVGVLLMAAVYFVRARQNENWEPLPPEQRFSEIGTWSLLWHRIFRPMTVPLAHLQTLAGAVLVVYQCDKFLGPPWNVVALALLAAGGAAAGLLLGSTPVLQGMFWLQLATALLLWREALGIETAARAPQHWMVHQLALLLVALTAAAAMALAGRRRRRSFLRFAKGGLLAAILGGFAAGAPALAPPEADRADWWTLMVPMVLAVVAVLWWILEIWPRPAPGEAVVSARWRRRHLSDRRWRTVAAVLVAELGVWAVLYASPSAVDGVAALAVAGALLGVASLVRGTPYLLLGLLLHLACTGYLALGYLDAGTAAHSLLRWTILSEATALSALLLTVCPRCRRGSFALGALVAFSQALAMMTWLALLPDQRFSPLWPWGLTTAGLMLVVELFRSSPARRAEDFDTWSDRRGETALRRYARPLAAVGAVLSSAVFGLIIGRATIHSGGALAAMSLTSGLLLIATLWRRSPYLMAALLTQLGLMGAYRILYSRQLVEQPMSEWVSVTLIFASAAALIATARRIRRTSFAWGGLLALALGMVGLGELLFNQRPGPSPSALWLVTFVLLWWAVESLRRGFGGEVAAEEGPWADTLDHHHLVRRARSLAVILSAAGAVLLIALTFRQFPSPVAMIFVTVLYAVLFVGLTAVVKSPAMAAGFAVCLTAAHPLFYLRVGAETAVGTAPLLALLVLSVTLAAGGAVEWIFRQHSGPARQRPAWWAAWYAYVLGFGLAGLFLQPLGEEVAGQASYGAAAQGVLAILVVAVGRSLRLRWAMRAAVLFALACSGLFVWRTVSEPEFRTALIGGGVALLLALVVLERLLVRHEPEELCRSAPVVGRLYGQVLVATAAVIGMVSLAFSRELGGPWTTAAWSALALVLILAGFAWSDRTYRRTALAVFALAMLRLALFDVARLEIYYRMLAFFCLGASMLAVSFLYARYRDKITRWL